MADEKTVDEELYEQFFAIVGEDKKISQGRAAKEMSVSPGIISLYKSKAYTGNIALLEEKIQAFIKREERRVSDINVPIADTTTLDNIKMAVEMAHDYRDITVIVGEAGVGKTTAIRKYQAENPGAAAVVYAYPGITQYKLMVEISKAIGVYGNGTQAVLMDRIVERLKGRDLVLIIDQADYLTGGSLELLRCISVDMTGIGLALVGLPRLETRLRNLRNDHEQLLSRVGTFLKIGKMRADDSAKIIRGVWESATSEVIEELTKAASGSVRTLIKLIERTHRIMLTYRKEVPNPGMIISASDLLMR
jgi:DNA transposition AAA+ family ATPase